MQLTQWNPFREMDEMLSRFRGRALAPHDDLSDWMPAVDISETDKEYLVRAELPGVKKDDVKVQSHNGVLSLSGERKFEKEEKDERHHRVERSYGSFTRSFVVPEDVIAEKIAAEFKDGVLTVRLPKTEIKQARPAAIKVQ